MQADRGERPFDIVLFGATGFTGGLTAEYLARARARPGCAGRWPAATRTSSRRCASGSRRSIRACAGSPLLIADVDRRRRRCARSPSAPGWSPRRSARTSRHGEPLVAACAAAGTDYVDLTGEPEFVDRMYVRHHATAVATGARLVHACGFDSIPHDLGVLFTVEQLPEDVPLTVRRLRPRRRQALRRAPSHSALTAFSRPRQTGAAARARGGGSEPRPAAARVVGRRRVAALRARARRLGAAAADDRPAGRQALGRRARALRARLPLRPLRGREAAAGRRSAASAASARLFALAQLPPTRDWLLGRLRSGRRAVARAARERSWFRVRFVGEGGGAARRHRGRRAATRATARPPRCSPSRRSASPATSCRRPPARSRPRSRWATR